MRDQKRWMKNWIRALAVGTMIAAAVPLLLWQQKRAGSMRTVWPIMWTAMALM